MRLPSDQVFDTSKWGSATEDETKVRVMEAESRVKDDGVPTRALSQLISGPRDLEELVIRLGFTFLQSSEWSAMSYVFLDAIAYSVCERLSSGPSRLLRFLKVDAGRNSTGQAKRDTKVRSQMSRLLSKIIT